MPNSLQPHGLQHARLLCPPLSSEVCSDSCPLSWWCDLTISSSAAPFFCLHSFPTSGSFPMGQLFESGASIGASASVQWIIRLISFRIDWFELLAVQGTLKSSPAQQFERISSLALSLLCGLGFPGSASYKEPACQCWRHKRQVWSLDCEDTLEEEMAIHSSILA